MNEYYYGTTRLQGTHSIPNDEQFLYIFSVQILNTCFSKVLDTLLHMIVMISKKSNDKKTERAQSYLQNTKRFTVSFKLASSQSFTNRL